MRAVLKMKWIIAALWVAASVILLVTAPSMAELVRTKGQITVPEGYSSSIAGELEQEIGQGEQAQGMSTVLVFHRDGGLSDADLKEVEGAAALLKQAGEASGIASVTTHFDIPDLREQMVAKDNSSVLVLLNVEANNRELAEQRDHLYELLEQVKVEHYYTGDWLINEDVIQSSQEGLKKTEYITVGFILIILFVVFRSAAAPLVPLLAVGFSYLTSQSIVAFLVEYADFPLSNFTQIFMVAILFGIGTDYCILLISRYKEELAHHGDRTEAIISTYRTAGKTVFFSGLAVLVGFASIGLSTFGLYRSAVAVAVGIAVLLLALYTLVPFFLSVLGNALFWPVKGSLQHKPNKLWGAAGSFSLRKPLWSLLILAVIIVPFLAAYKGAISYNSLDEIGEKYHSVKGFNLIADNFGPGETLPATVLVKSEEPLDTPAGLAAIEQASRELLKVEGVKTTRSATRPTGEVMEQFLVADQVVLLDNGLGKSGEGLDQISSGLSEASSALLENKPMLTKAATGAEQLVQSTDQLRQGMKELGIGLKQIEKGMRDGSLGAAELKKGLAESETSARQLAAAGAELAAGYEQLGGGIAQLSDAYLLIAEEQGKLAAGLSGVQQKLEGLAVTYPELQADQQYQEALGGLAQLQQGAAGIGAQLAELNKQLQGAADGIKQANAGLVQASSGQTALTNGLQQLVAGIGELQKGIAQAADGQGKMVAGMPALETGLDMLSAGQRELGAGFSSLNEQLGELTGGLDQSVAGLTQVSDGLSAAGGYLQNLAESPDRQMTGWYIPQEAIENEQFQSGLDMYMSPDRKTAKLDVIFASNPYSTDTMSEISSLKGAVERAFKGTPYAQAEIAVGGVTSMNHDLSEISGADYSRTVMLMLIGISIILIFMFRSIVIPIYVVISLLITFYTSLAITEVIFVRMVGLSGISWAVPFFGFVILIALGVDYSIFLMDRFKEYRHIEPKKAILEAMKNMGAVIMSAAVILGGTFAAMLPSGVMSLLQIATIVLCGLFLYALVMLPLFIPVMVRMFGPANWWPFMFRER